MINQRFRNDLQSRGILHEQIEHMAPVGDGKVRMAWLSCYGSYSINGVAALHTEILKTDTLKDWYEIWPERFQTRRMVLPLVVGSGHVTQSWLP